MGTRFLATRESLWSAPRKAGLVAGQGDQTLQSRIFDTLSDPGWPMEYPARFLRNTTSARWAGKEAELEATADAERARYAEVPLDDLERRLTLSGEGVDLITDVPTAREVVERTVAEAIAVLRDGAALVRN